ncbi:MAG: leucine-rich repeat domain-containing protein, partial [Anaerolineales bacterium]|nr:leucine-rich repeat domain-containing protein [Anaerolineales bacterium]
MPTLHHQNAADPDDRILNLDNSQIADLPATFPPHLRQLSAYNNQLTHLPAALWELADLEVLNLSANRLTDLPDGIGRLTKLQMLDLGHN